MFESLMAEPEEFEPEVYLNYATLLAGAQPSRLADARAVLDRGMRRLGPMATLAEAAMDIEIRRRRWDSALKYADAVIAHASRKDYWLRRRGEILQKAGRACEAVDAYRAALASIETLSRDVQTTPTFETAKVELSQLLQDNQRRSCAEKPKRTGAALSAPL
jgi:hypothetical protein